MTNTKPFKLVMSQQNLSIRQRNKCKLVKCESAHYTQCLTYTQISPELLNIKC